MDREASRFEFHLVNLISVEYALTLLLYDVVR